MLFGNPVELAWSAMRVGLTHPRVVRYEAALRLLRRAAHALTVRQHHDGQVRRLQAARDAFAGAPALPLALRIAALSAPRAAAAAPTPAPPLESAAAPKRKAGGAGPAPVVHDIDRLKKKQLAPVAPPAWVATAPPAIPWSAGGAAALPLGKAVGKPPRAKRAEAAAALTAAASLGAGLFATLRLAFCEPSAPPLPGAPPLPARRMGVGALVASLRLRSERARGMNKKDAATAVEAALRFLAREGPPGPLVAQAGTTSAAEPTYVWAGPPWGCAHPWWREDLHGPPPASVTDAGAEAGAAAVEARFTAWLTAEAAGADDPTADAAPAVAAA